MKALFSQPTETVESRVAYGSQAQVHAGTGSTRLAPHDCNDGWFAGDSTIILGADEPRPTATTKTVATWSIAVEPSIVRSVRSGFLIIACERSQGGLHTQQCGALARVEINGHNRDIIGLKDIPGGHTDYFHRVQVPQLPDIWPVTACGTIYAWPVYPGHLQEAGNQTVRVEIDTGVSWDIDYVVLALTVAASVTQVPDWIKQLVYATIGAVLGALATLLLGG